MLNIPDQPNLELAATAVEPSESIPLSRLARGQSGRVRIQGTSTEVKMLRAMGLRPNASVTMCRFGEPCIVSLSGACGGGCRIGLAKEIAGRVMVDPDSPING